MDSAPIFILTMGDPAGIGPQIAVSALSQPQQLPCRIVIIGDLEVLQKAAQTCGFSPVFKSVNDIQKTDRESINVLDMNETSTSQFTPGIPQAECGKAAYRYITEAISFAMDKKAAAVITNPVSKESLKLAGINYPGHTEIFADKTGTNDYSMVFLLDNVAVAHVTTHVSLRRALELISKERVLKQIRLLNRSLKSLGIDPPRLAVAGLNPHAGENGLFGNEEITEINPAIEQARIEGINVSGPYPPDTVFNRSFKGEFNGVVAMLHDHGFVALKSRDFEHGVNITVGLPIIRTSVGHGTAFDKAWGKDKSSHPSPASLLSAIDAASKIVRNCRTIR
ncbi:MAG: 4-hydroxythreonine-4-phosphate dehydrogenase PdxA [Chitinispirillales bacterium]|jgi:4-hydroxythreonine-4-phosphate dehydrogenase|nr:4-hydroxythreonine-4-phosphate dehydrogenase PdxA [Chitinispirillales bacterium]